MQTVIPVTPAQAAALAKSIRMQLAAYAESEGTGFEEPWDGSIHCAPAESNESVPTLFTGQDLDAIAPLLPLLESLASGD